MAKKSKPSIALPKGVLKSDLKYSSPKNSLGYDQLKEMGINYGWLEMWYTERFGWVIPTLAIAKARQGSGYADRTYATAIDGTHCRVGRGPHVLRQITIFVSKKNIKRLAPLVEILKSGMLHANDTRDRISTRRMRRYIGF